MLDLLYHSSRSLPRRHALDLDEEALLGYIDHCNAPKSGYSISAVCYARRLGLLAFASSIRPSSSLALPALSRL